MSYSYLIKLEKLFLEDLQLDTTYQNRYEMKQLIRAQYNHRTTQRGTNDYIKYKTGKNRHKKRLNFCLKPNRWFKQPLLIAICKVLFAMSNYQC